MLVTIFGATGQVGRHLLIHSLARGWKVRAFGRKIHQWVDEDLRNDQWEAIQGYVFNESDVRKAIQGTDGVLSALGGAFDGADKTRSLGMKHIVQQMQATNVRRIVALGGLGILPGADGGYRMDDPEYPKEFLPVGNEHRAAYEYLRESGLDWTFVCSPDILNEDSDGRFEARADEPGPSGHIRAGNLALFMVQALESGQYLKQRVGIGDLP